MLFRITLLLLAISSSINALNTIDCDDPLVDCGENEKLSCPAGDDCLISCIGEEICVKAKFTCADDYDCTFICKGRQSCREATLECPTGGKCNVECGNTEAGKNEWKSSTCKGFRVDGADDDLTIDAYGRYGAVREARINCPVDAKCTVNCGTDADLEDDNGGNFQDTGPKYICKQSYFWADLASEFTMNGIGDEVFKQATIICPETENAPCVVHGVGGLKPNGKASKNVFDQTRILVNNGKNTVDLQCDITTDWNDEGLGEAACYPLSAADDDLGAESYDSDDSDDEDAGIGSPADPKYAPTLVYGGYENWCILGVGSNDMDLECIADDDSSDEDDGEAMNMGNTVHGNGSSVNSPIIAVLCLLLVIATATAIFFGFKAKKAKQQLKTETNIVIELGKGKEAEITYDDDDDNDNDNDVTEQKIDGDDDDTIKTGGDTV